MKNKMVLIPGWMNEKGMYGDRYEVLEIWRDKINPENKIDSDWVISHSIGTNFSLLNWEKFKNTKHILVNPLVLRRGFKEWVFRWMRFHKEEKKPESKKIATGFLRRIFGIKMSFKLLKLDVQKILDEIPKENLVILRGKSDFYFCDEESAQFIRSRNIKLIEVEGGHDWNEKFDEEIEKLFL